MAIQQETFKKLVFGASGLVIIGLASAFIWNMVTGLVGLLAIAGISATALALLPAASQWLTNLKYKAFTGVISRDPINSLYSEQEESAKDLKEAAQAIEDQGTQVEKLALKLKEYRKVQTDPEQIASWEERLSDYGKLLAHNVDLFKEAKAEHNKFGKIIEIAEMDWEMASTDAVLAKTFNKNDDFMRQLRKKTALDAVQTASARSRSRLKMALLDQEKTLEEVKGNEPVHAINFDKDGKVDLGNILDVQVKERVVR